MSLIQYVDRKSIKKALILYCVSEIKGIPCCFVCCFVVVLCETQVRIITKKFTIINGNLNAKGTYCREHGSWCINNSGTLKRN